MVYDIIIIGAGIAGLTGAIYGQRAGKNVLVIEGRGVGGQITESPLIENYPGIESISGFDFTQRLYKQAQDLGVNFVFSEVRELKNGKADTSHKGNIEKIIYAGDTEYHAKTVIAAGGLKKRKTGLEKEEYFTGRGISYCATCDGAFFKGRTVAVMGGGNSAVSEAIYLSDICKEVYLIHRRDTLRAQKELIKKLESAENVTLILNSTITGLKGTDVLEDIEVLKSDSGKKENIKVDGLFVCIGQTPQNEYLGDEIEKDESGYIITDGNCHTNVTGIFAAGDCRKKKLRQLVTAACDGAVSAAEACELLDKT